MRRALYAVSAVTIPALGIISLVSCISGERAVQVSRAVEEGARAAGEAAASGADPLTVVLAGAGGVLAGILGGVVVGRRRNGP